MVIQFEYTALDTPQQNHLAEIGIYVICSRGQALMSCAKIPYKYWYIVFILSTKTACKLDWLQVVETPSGKKKMKYELFSGRKPNFANHLQTFGEAGVVTTVDRKIKDKVDIRGVVCMVGG